MREPSRSRLRVAGIGMALVLAAALLAWMLAGLGREVSAPKRQVARIALLPDKPPPPPPPPPKEMRKDEPSPQARPQARPDDAPKPQAANEPIKMEGAAGNGPSAFAAGTVTNDYRGGTPTVGGPAASAATVADRAAERLYANTVRQMLHDEIQRQLGPDAGELSANFSLWIGGDGRIARWESDASAPALKSALDRSASALQLPTPPALAQPMRFRLTVRAGA